LAHGSVAAAETLGGGLTWAKSRRVLVRSHLYRSRAWVEADANVRLLLGLVGKSGREFSFAKRHAEERTVCRLWPGALPCGTRAGRSQLRERLHRLSLSLSLSVCVCVPKIYLVDSLCGGDSVFRSAAPKKIPARGPDPNIGAKSPHTHRERGRERYGEDARVIATTRPWFRTSRRAAAIGRLCVWPVDLSSEAGRVRIVTPRRREVKGDALRSTTVNSFRMCSTKVARSVWV
jgi:hypothetical protein